MALRYDVCLEISGPYAMWTRPDTGDCPVSYPAPTFSAAKSIFESILWGPAVEVVPYKAEICCPVVYHNYQTNYGGPLKKTGTANYQLLATVLVDVCYRLYATVLPARHGKSISLQAQQWDKKTTSPGHAYQEIFNRRLKRGQSWHVPSLGWKEFTPDYVGPLRPDTKVEEELQLELPSMLQAVFSDGYKSQARFTFRQNVRIVNGSLSYDSQEVNHAE